jgi:hypothetical protein
LRACGITARRWSIRLGWAILTLAAGTQGAWAADPWDVNFTVEAKLWSAEWNSWDAVVSKGSAASPVQSVSAGTTSSPIVKAGVSYGNFLLVASYLLTTNYSLGGAIDPDTGAVLSQRASRKEVDVNAGYFVSTGFAATIGYKEIEQIFGGASYQWGGPIVGISGGVPIRDALSMYSSFAAGFMTLKAPVPDAAGSTHANADYVLADLGLAYTFETRHVLSSIKLTLGYRAQVLTTRNYAASTGGGGFARVNVHDVTYGPAFAVSGSF